MLKQNQFFDVIIIGAGFSGVLAALELPTSYKVALFEIEESIIPPASSSFNQCYKLHTGLHYAYDPETAVKCLYSTLQFAKAYKNYLLGSYNLPWRRGRHYFLSTSLVDIEHVKKLARTLQRIYEEESPNFVLGKPEDFIKFLSQKEYDPIAKEISVRQENGHKKNAYVQFALETGESQINFPLLREHLRQEIEQRDNIHFYSSREVNKINFDFKNILYNVCVKNTHNKTQENYLGRSVINACWQNIEHLDPFHKSKGFIRIKASILIKLPKELVNIHTLIFSIGPYCSLTNLGNGTAILTEELASNIDLYALGEKPSRELLHLLQKKIPLNDPVGNRIAHRILHNSIRYIPLLNKANIIELRLGHVKILSDDISLYSLYHENSPIHQRKEEGVLHNGLNYISLSGMKMTYTYKNAQRVSKIIARDFLIREMLNELKSTRLSNENLIEAIAVKTKFSLEEVKESLPIQLLRKIKSIRRT